MDRTAPCPAKSKPRLSVSLRTLLRATTVAAVLRAPLRACTSAAGFIATRRDLARSRAQLCGMEPHRLHDIGLTTEAAAREASRPVWDAPHHWLRK